MILTEKTHRLRLLSVPSIPIDELIITSAKASFNKADDYKSISDDRKLSLMKYLIRNHHTTPFQQPYITFFIEAPLFTIRQIRTYRLAVHNETSYRYTDATSEESMFYLPNIRKQSKSNKQGSDGLLEDNNYQELIKKHVEDSYKLYQSMINDGVAREVARMVLPVNIYSGIVTTMSLHGWLHFLDQRLKKDAQDEVRQVALDIQKHIYKLNMPIFIEAMRQLEEEGIDLKW